ncbi:hypothetical protein [Thioclava kandeliae]|uniref:Helix-turn-helix domain-containing protein n=1 Tax=Thioclava kandeliae TaxID=3070818 RepID=A0ABV1SIT9_9RHOB
MDLDCAVENLRSKVVSALDEMFVLAEELRSLNEVEKRLNAACHRDYLRVAKERGVRLGRRPCMTDERALLADKLIESGCPGTAVYKAIRALPGPKISQATYYAWQKVHKW